jgi:hypothetical protein
MIRYVPQQYPDLASALHASASGDEVVLDTSASIPLNGVQSALDNITVRAAPGRRPVLDHTEAYWASPMHGLRLGSADGWTFQGITFRDRRGASAAVFCNGDGLLFEDCTFEGSSACLRGNWSGVVRRCDFRRVQQSVATTTSAGVRFEACRFIACEVFELLTLPGDETAVEHCTLVRCTAGDEETIDGANLVEAEVVRANTALECRARDPESSRAIFRGTTVCTFNNAWQCDADALFAGDDVVADNMEVDPRHVHPLIDQRLLPDSGLIGAAVGTAVEFDRAGGAFLAPPSVGAHESARLGAITVESLTSIVAAVSGGVPDLAACLDRESWSLATPSGVRVAVMEVARVGETDALRLTLHPAMSAGQGYVLRLSPAGYGWNTAGFTPGSELFVPYPWRRYRNIAAVMNAIGIGLFRVGGRSEATIIRDFLPTDRTIFVDSTRDFPPAGTLVSRDYRMTYVSKTDGAFHGVIVLQPRIVAIPAGTRVVVDERRVVPAAG